MAPRLPHPIPFGWFCIAFSDEVAVGDVKPLNYFDRDLVLFRDETGDIGLLDAYCPHLGAHLGYGGRVRGNSIQCPFHAWQFNKEGFCIEIPYAKRLPPKVDGKQCLHSYPVVEKNKVIWAWYHPQNTAPFFDVMDHGEVNDPEWVDLIRYEWTFRSNPQEIAENGVDVAHFRYVHSMDAVPEGTTSYDGHIRVSIAEGTREIPKPDGGSKRVMSKVETVQNGAGQKYTRFTGLSETLLMTLVTPVTADEVHFRFAFTHKDFPKDSMEYQIAQASIETTAKGQSGVEGDIPIWAHKKHHHEPILCDGDGPIMRFRKYFKQFYVDSAVSDDSENQQAS